MDNISRRLKTPRETFRRLDRITQTRLHNLACITAAPEEHGGLAAFVAYLAGESLREKTAIMIEPCPNSDTSRKRVIALFFLSLLFMAVLAIGIGKVVGNLGEFHLGWLNPAIGLVLVISGFVLVSWSVHVQYAIGKGTPTPRFATQKLVTQGPYTYTRNPMTLGALLLYLGIGVWSGSGVVIFLTVMIFSGLLMFIYHHETRELTDRFGDEYLEYKKRTPFLWPRFW